MPAYEFDQWCAFFEWENEERKKAEKKNNKGSGKRPNTKTTRY